jgi:hypothetical protein
MATTVVDEINRFFRACQNFIWIPAKLSFRQREFLILQEAAGSQDRQSPFNPVKPR